LLDSLLQEMLLVVLLLAPPCLSQRWVLLGGYTGFEGELDAGATAQMELLRLRTASSYADELEWCQKNLSVTSKPLDGATISEVSSFKYIEATLANANNKDYFTSSHHSAQFHRLLVCGGADDKYKVEDACDWWMPETDSWELGPKMSRPRYQAASVSFPQQGQVWMLGGRDGSTILQDNEVLQYPADWNKPSKTFVLKRWEWAHKKMKNIEVWHKGVVGFPDPTRGESGDSSNPGMKQMPMPLAGHCAVNVNGNGVFVIGGGTNERNSDGTFQTNSAPEPTQHIHLFHRQGPNANKWSSSLTNSDLVKGTVVLVNMNVPRMNHACLKIGNDIFVAGGVTTDNFDQRLVTKKVERYNIASNSWRFEADLPSLITGFKLVQVDGRPAIVGRYGAEQTNRLWRYSEDKVWVPLSIKLLLGRSDFQIADPLPASVKIFPVMSSKETRFNSGSGKTPGWRNKLGAVQRGVREAFETNAASRPWMQLDMGEEVTVKKVWFESGACTACDGSSGDPITVQDSEVRVGSSLAAANWVSGTDVTDNPKCSDNVDGSETGGNGKQWARCQNRKGRYVTIQLVDATPSTKLKIKHIAVELATVDC